MNSYSSDELLLIILIMGWFVKQESPTGGANAVEECVTRPAGRRVSGPLSGPFRRLSKKIEKRT